MPIHDYGVWKARPVSYKVEHAWDDPHSPHLSLYFDDGKNPDQYSKSHHGHGGKHLDKKKHGHKGRGNGGSKEIPGLWRAAINIKSGDRKESRLVFWMNKQFQDNPVVNNVAELPFGFTGLEDAEEAPGGQRLDYIRGNLFNVNSGRLLPHDIQGPNNDMIDVLEPEIKKAIDLQAEIYLFGERFNTKNGIHNIHMNQGNVQRFARDDGIFQDGGLLINYPDSDQWIGVFDGFASQAVDTDNDGHAATSETWADYLSADSQRADLLENSVSIDEASIDSDDQPTSRRKSVTLTNLTDHKVNVGGWKVKNSAGQTQRLPSNAVLDSKGTNAFDLSNVGLSNIADTVTLLNEKNLKVDGVSYNSHPGKVHGQSVVFAH